MSTKMYYVLFTKVLQGADTASGNCSSEKDVQEFVVKTIDIYTYKEFLKFFFQNWTFSQIFFKDFDHNYYINSLKYAVNRTLFFRNTCHIKLKKRSFSKGLFN